MTTIVYRKGIGLLGDKRGVGSDPGYTDTCQKLFSYENSKGQKFHLGTAGTLMIPGVIYDLMQEHFENGFFHMKLYDFQKDLSKINFDKTYDYIFIVTNLTIIRVFHINNNFVEESNHIYSATGSGSALIDGILLANPDISNEELFKLISSHDIYTSSEFDLIPIK